MATPAQHIARRSGVLKTAEVNTINFLTQNVRGLSIKDGTLDVWLNIFKTRDTNGIRDVVILQETHVPVGGGPERARRHAASWGYTVGPGARTLSFWSESSGRAAGTAILINPHSRLTDPKPWLEELWSPYSCAITAQLDEKTIGIVCVYGPRDADLRRSIFSSIGSITPAVDILLIGGDFNCTLHPEFDRSHPSKADKHDSPELRLAITQLDLADCLAPEMALCGKESDARNFRTRHHTYVYNKGGSIAASSRIDRWYISRNATDWIQSCTVELASGPSDHEGVTIRLANPRYCTRMRRDKRVYPPAMPVQEAVIAACEEVMTSFDAQQTADLLARWDSLKHELRRSCLVTARMQQKRLTESIKQKLRRLRKTLALTRAEIQGRDTVVEGRSERDAASSAEDPPVSRSEAVVGNGARETSKLCALMEELSLSHSARVTSIRNAISSYERKRQTRKQQATFDKYKENAADAERNFFSRFSVKYGPTSPLRLPSAHMVSPSDPCGAANTLATDWTPTLQQTPATSTAMNAWFELLPRPGRVPRWTALVAPISEAEVTDAVKALGRNKACGPDRMPNAWYKDNIGMVGPILVKVFNHCLDSGEVPLSFCQATIFCIPKTSTPVSGLCFRPIALLNSDYKLLTRVLATRLAPLMPAMIHKVQNGFVGGRQIHDSIDVLSAVQRLVKLGLAPRAALVLMLDFQKAYDSLDRTYLTRALQWHGLPPAFVALVGRLHEGTTANFQANGFLSKTIPVHNGIRQGCPLAPMLFVLALDLLFRRIEVDPGCPGISVAHSDMDLRIAMSGYADDVALFLNGPEEEPQYLKILNAFQAASGLTLNMKKCVAVCLHPAGPLPIHAAMRISPVPADQPTRYLGIPVSAAPAVSAVWTATVRAIQVRTILALHKTADVLQRCKLAAAIIVPKILFVARHVWPTADIVERLDRAIHTFVWTGHFLEESGSGRKALLNRHHSQLSQHDGGVGEPNIRVELRAMAASTVATWAHGRAREAQAVGDVLLWQRGHGSMPKTVWITPRPDGGSAPTWKTTLWMMGMCILQHSHGSIRGMVEIEGISCVVSQALSLRHKGVWINGQWCCDFAHITTDARLLHEVQSDTHGHTDMRWLPMALVTGGGILLDNTGTALRHRAVSLIAKPYSSIAEVVAWQWLAANKIQFSCVSVPYPMTTRAADQFRDLCVILVANYPRLLRRPAAPDTVTPYDHSEPEWTVRRTFSATELYVEAFPAPTRLLGRIYSSNDMERRAGASCVPRRRTLAMWAHPAISRLVQLWPGTRRWNKTKKQYKALERSAHQEAALEAVSTASRALQWRHDRIGNALEGLSWKSIHKIAGSTSQQRRLLFKIKSNRISGWDATRNSIGCPHPECATLSWCDTAHIMWECPAAQHVWSLTTAAWRGLGAWPTTHSSTPWLDSIFGLSFPPTPAAVWSMKHMIALGTRAQAVATIAHSTVLPVWRLQVLHGYQTIWRWRHSYRDPGRSLDAAAVAATLQHTRLRTTYDALHALATWGNSDEASDRAIVLRTTLEIFKAKPQPEPPPCSIVGRTVLFFDGGSRGNPGPGGSGAVLIQLDLNGIGASIMWAGSASFASCSTTNNYAEYQGLIWGLTAAARHHVGRIHVVGDSAMILRQLRTNTPPRSTKLRQLYANARLLADRIGVDSWQHHYRAHNKMADHLANQAMDSRCSAQDCFPTANIQLEGLQNLLANDMGHWISNPSNYTHTIRTPSAQPPSRLQAHPGAL